MTKCRGLSNGRNMIRFCKYTELAGVTRVSYLYFWYLQLHKLMIDIKLNFLWFDSISMPPYFPRFIWAQSNQHVTQYWKCTLGITSFIFFFPHLASILFLANDNSRFMIMITIIGNERWGPQEIQCIVTYDHVSLMYCYHTEDCKTWREKTWIRQRFSGSFWVGRRRKKIECDGMHARFATTVWH